jgi:hypothetical protein
MSAETPVEAGPKYDVAISFLSSDEPIARELYEGLEGLETFFYPRRQEEMAGTDGLETMRRPFLDCRVMVVLYREGWGETPWTGVEAQAIKEHCHKTQYRGLMFVQLEKPARPQWVPETHIYFNMLDFGMEQLIGAVKLRALEIGSRIAPLDPIARGVRARAEADYQAERLRLMRDLQWIKGNVEPAIRTLVETIKERAGELNDKAGYEIDVATYRGTVCALRQGPVSVVVEWRQPYANSLFDDMGFCGLSVKEFAGRVLLPSEQRIRIVDPRLIVEHTFKPDISRSRKFVLKVPESDTLVALGDMPNRIFPIFFNLIERDARGEIEPPTIFDSYQEGGRR